MTDSADLKALIEGLTEDGIGPREFLHAMADVTMDGISFMKLAADVAIDGDYEIDNDEDGPEEYVLENDGAWSQLIALTLAARKYLGLPEHRTWKDNEPVGEGLPPPV